MTLTQLLWPAFLLWRFCSSSYTTTHLLLFSSTMRLRLGFILSIYLLQAWILLLLRFFVLSFVFFPFYVLCALRVCELFSVVLSPSYRVSVIVCWMNVAKWAFPVLNICCLVLFVFLVSLSLSEFWFCFPYSAKEYEEFGGAWKWILYRKQLGNRLNSAALLYRTLRLITYPKMFNRMSILIGLKVNSQTRE